MKLSRRNLLKFAGATGTAAMVQAIGESKASASAAQLETRALLIDTTKCIGCRGCEAACSEVNQLPPPASAGDRKVFEQKRMTDVDVYTVVNQVDAPEGKKTRYAKTQCMHCLEPACASACLARALDKTPEGPVVYHPERCMGCRYCMMACPFEIPRFEYGKAAPYIRKCEFCAKRQKEGKNPACETACPTGALKFGKRGELLEEAKTRIYQNPDQYQHHVYGEEEVGGTGVLYLADVGFEKLGLRTDLGEKGYPEYTSGPLSLVPFVMTLWPPLLMGIYTFSKSRDAEAKQADAAKGTHHE